MARKETHEVTLSDGRIIRMIRPKGKHLRKASLVSGSESQTAIFMALAALVSTVVGMAGAAGEGQKREMLAEKEQRALVYEDLDEMDLSDVATLIAGVGELVGNSLLLGLGTSSA